MPPGPTHKPAPTWMLWLLPLALWALATGYHGFDLGKYSDDWSQSLINPDTGRIDWAYHPWVRWPYFFRPLYFVVVWTINTLYWNHDWVRHAIAALAHLGVGALLFRFLCRAGIGSGPAACAAMLFLVWPVQYEAVLWPAAIGLPLAAACFLVAAAWFARFAAQTPDGRPWGRAATMASLTFLAACFHEQPAACVAALPALYLACRPRGQTIGVAARRVVISVGACGGACLVYAMLLAGTAPPGRRGSGASLVGLEGADERLGSFLGQVRSWLGGSKCIDVVIGPTLLGAESVLSHPVGLVWAIVVAAVAVAWVIALARPRVPLDSRSPWCLRRGWLMLFGIGVAVSGLVPVALTRNNAVFSRYFYPVGLGGAVALAAILDCVRVLMPRWAMSILGAAAACAAVGGALALVFWQEQFRERARMDHAIVQQLRAATPAVPRRAVLVPISIDQRGPTPSRTFPAGDVPGALSQPWASWAIVQRSLHRSDVSATCVRPGARPPLSLEDGGLRALQGVRDAWGRIDASRSVVPWALVVPFVVQSDGRVEVLTPDEARQRLTTTGAANR